MEPGSLGVTVRLASAALTPLVRKLFAQPGRGADLVDRPVRVSGLVAWRGEPLGLSEPQVRKLAGELVRRTLEAAPEHEPPFPPDERTALVDALATTLLALGDIEADDVQAVRLGHRGFARLLRQHAPADVDRDLSAAGSAAYAELLDLCCLHVLHFFTQRSGFVARTLLEQSQQLQETLGRLDLLLDRIPHQAGQDSAFERRYREYLAKRHGTLTIFGLDLRSGRASWPLDYAYLSLEAAPSPVPAPQPVIPLGPRPADQALADQRRVLLRGVAGSGKTTLVQWLAVTAARQDVTSCPPYLLGTVPFVLPLRTVVRRGPLPDPGQLLHSAGNPLHGAQPAGWADRVLSQGRALLLVDGIDEIPERDREHTRAWLADLIAAYPECSWLVTSRPSAVADDWLDGPGFQEFTLSPMTPAEVGTFVRHWHDAARAVTDDDAERERLDGFQSALADALHRKQDLARLATNPLMCGLICALHRDRRAHLPRGRKELYDAALSMLLERRDVERDVGELDGIRLSEAEQVQLLQRLAYWLVRNGQSELEHEVARELVEGALPSMRAVAEQGDAGRILRHLLDRSGLLRRPTAETVDFVHRTFQDYLAAKAAVEAHDLGLLVSNAHDDQWEDVIRMAVAHARPDERARLLRKLVSRGDRRRTHRTRLHLLATACLEQATELDPAVREAVERRAATLVPPHDNDAAKALAEAGPMVLDLLPGPEGLTDEEALLVVVTASNVASDAAIAFLRQYRDHASLDVRAQLAHSWHRYDTERYAVEVIAHLEETDLDFVVDTADQLRALHRLGGRTRISLRRPLTEAELEYLPRNRLRKLALPGSGLSDDLTWLRRFPHLTELSLTPSPGTDLTPVAELNLRRLTVWGPMLPRFGEPVLVSVRQVTVIAGGPLADHLRPFWTVTCPNAAITVF